MQKYFRIDEIVFLSFKNVSVNSGSLLRDNSHTITTDLYKVYNSVILVYL